MASKNNKSINIGLLAGMDISTVKFNYGDNAGYNLGLMAGYQHNRQWSVYTGIIYTKKNYKLNGSDYHPPKTLLDAVCKTADGRRVLPHVGIAFANPLHV